MSYLFSKSSKQTTVEPEDFIVTVGEEEITMPKLGSLTVAEKMRLEQFKRKAGKVDPQWMSDLPDQTFIVAFSIALDVIREKTLNPKLSKTEYDKRIGLAVDILTGNFDDPKVTADEETINQVYLQFWTKELTGWAEDPNPNEASEGNDQMTLTGTEST